MPETWEEYNRVAKFFTRKYNLDSETIYGTTLGAMNAVGAVCEYLPRAWAEGGAVFENGKVVIDSDACVKALSLYIDSFAYASPKSPAHWWDEQVDIFARGDAAMMVMYSDHATPLEDRSVSNVVGRVLRRFWAAERARWMSIGVSAYSDKKRTHSSLSNGLRLSLMSQRYAGQNRALWAMLRAANCTTCTQTGGLKHFTKLSYYRATKGESVSYAIMEPSVTRCMLR